MSEIGEIYVTGKALVNLLRDYSTWYYHKFLCHDKILISLFTILAFNENGFVSVIVDKC